MLANPWQTNGTTTAQTWQLKLHKLQPTSQFHVLVVDRTHAVMIPGTLACLATADFHPTIHNFGAARHARLIGLRRATVTPMTTRANGHLRTAEHEAAPEL